METNKGDLLAMGKQIHNKHFGGLENLDLELINKDVLNLKDKLDSILKNGRNRVLNEKQSQDILDLMRSCEVVIYDKEEGQKHE
jgi:hypothetical protein|tara:strand:+ start:195 stop:446 length:252 start_codon:yes stop_codon:yes gene_type:complete